MSAIAGILHRNGAPVSRADLLLQADCLCHRGAEMLDPWIDGPIGVSVRLHPGAPRHDRGQQPALAGNGRYHLLVSGTVFNRSELARELAEGEERPRLRSSAEVLLAAFLRWGEEGFARCNGAFACTIWDARDRRLILARDPLGIEPILYWITDALVVFASEAKAIVNHPAHRRAVDEVAVADYLSCNRYRLVNGRTFYRGVASLRPGRVIEIDDRGVGERTYWRPDLDRRKDFGSPAATVEAIRHLMLDAVRIRLPEGDRIGAALSGGFDSSSIVCMIDLLNRTERVPPAALDTFSFTFGTNDADEVDLIDLVARRTDARHHHVPALAADLFDDLEDMIRINDGPILETGTLLLWRKKKAARDAGIDVLLSGLGGDELFMGRVNFLADLVRRGRLGEFWRELRGIYPEDRSTGKRTRLKQLLVAYVYAPLEPPWLKDFRKIRLQRSWPPAWINRDLVRRAGMATAMPRPEPPRFRDVFDQDCFEVFHYELLGGAVHYQSVASAAFAVDTRFPLLDIRLVEAMFALPREWKISRGRVRIMQKLAMQDILPTEVLADHLKKDFHPTFEAFLRASYRQHLEPLLNGSDHASDAYVNWRALGAEYDAYMAGRAKSFPLGVALTLETWLRRCF